MSRVSQKVKWSAQEKETLKAWSGSVRQQKRLVDRARIILMNIEGYSDSEIARELKTRPNTVGKWRGKGLLSKAWPALTMPRGQANRFYMIRREPGRRF